MKLITPVELVAPRLEVPLTVSEPELERELALTLLAVTPARLELPLTVRVPVSRIELKVPALQVRLRLTVKVST